MTACRRVAASCLVLGALAGCSSKASTPAAAPAVSTTTPSTAVAGGAASVATADGGASTTTPVTAPSSSSTTAAGSTPKRPGYHPARPGTYTYDVDGKAHSTMGDFPMPPTSELRVETARGNEQTSTRDTGQGTMEQTVRYTALGVLLVSQKVSGVQGNIEFRPDQPALLVPASAMPGHTWAWSTRSTDGKIALESRFTLLRTETVQIGGRPGQTLVIKATTTTTGDASSTSETTAWWSPEHSIGARQDGTTTGSYGAIKFDSKSTERLRSVQPS
jgi:hypothetical protein